jgi:hypothetical protein
MRKPTSKTARRSIRAAIRTLKKLDLDLGRLDRLEHTKKNRYYCIRINYCSRSLNKSVTLNSRTLRHLLNEHQDQE